jgi:hypothetical protein
MTSEGAPPDNERNDQDHSDGSYKQYNKRFPFLCAHGSTSQLRHDIDKVSDQEIQDIVITASLTPGKCLSFGAAARFPKKRRVLTALSRRLNIFQRRNSFVSEQLDRRICPCSRAGVV